MSFAATAGAAPDATATNAASESVKISASRYHMEPQEFQDYQSAYRLSNGETMRFTRQVGHFYTEIKGQPRVEIYAVGPAEFITRTGAHMSFTDNGDTLTVSNYERLPMLAKLPANTTIMAKR
ncbi:hypothetical protein D0T25_17950 [Duganella sp. BJB488]|nr:hypothetical protein D0T26_17580 [Duganella sp. BJB489]RFP20865.1 hypothetical protein D0T25_17950 [Duganella sp. BJB488]RFP32072.1 hypothetical protein D0T24_20955 [Duganella sp. BJB480]